MNIRLISGGEKCTFASFADNYWRTGRSIILLHFTVRPTGESLPMRHVIEALTGNVLRTLADARERLDKWTIDPTPDHVPRHLGNVTKRTINDSTAVAMS